MTLSSYRPGSWFGVFGSETTVLIPGSEKARVGALWARVDDGADFDAVLDELLASGLGTLPGFVLLSAGEGPTKLLVRGHVVVSGVAGGEEFRIDGSTALTWVERTLMDVESLRIELEAAVADDGSDAEAVGDLPIVGGLVRVSRVDRPAVRPAADSAAGDIPLPEPPLPEPEPGPVPEEEAPDTEPVDPSDHADAGPLDVPIEPPGPPDSADHDGLTRTGRPGEESSVELPGIPGQQQAPRIVAPVARLLLSNGESVEVDRAVLIGRAPEARRFTSTEQPRLVKVPSPLHEISSTHVEVRPGSGADHGTAVVTDMGSTNGTVIDQPGLGPESLRPGIAVQLMPGATINLGDGVSIQVLRP